MDFGRAFRFPFGDTNWVSKLLIGTLVSFVPILNFAAIGYVADVTRELAGGRETPLPEWNNFGNLFVRGFKMIVVQLLYALPLLVLACPIVAFAAIASANDPNGELTGTAAAVFGCGILLIMLLSLLIAPISVAASTRFAVTDRFAEALPGPTLAMLRGRWRPWLMAIVFLIGASIVFGLASACTFGLLGIVLSFYIQLIAAFWYAQAYRETAGSYAMRSSMV